jgi:hypothetical protein
MSMKTSYEIAMERLQKKDAESGETGLTLTLEQKEEIARIRQFHKAKLAEREILHQGDMSKARGSGDPEAVRTVEKGYHRERARIEEEMEAKIDAVRKGRSPSE